ncbi:hypothetical protein MUK42_37670 [Musa troglodytarum]|uniref:Uncharacterized protein n=1 Tax=Musa troglodytarum TaxID=320322 RepID=A0A9E7EF04_9LILI|nr:hypothetical protein MUK42_37670 [Musa troglodytarum]
MKVIRTRSDKDPELRFELLRRFGSINRLESGPSPTDRGIFGGGAPPPYQSPIADGREPRLKPIGLPSPSSTSLPRRHPFRIGVLPSVFFSGDCHRFLHSAFGKLLEVF